MLTKDEVQFCLPKPVLLEIFNFVMRYCGFSIHKAFKDYKSLVSRFGIANPEDPKNLSLKTRITTQKSLSLSFRRRRRRNLILYP